MAALEIPVSFEPDPVIQVYMRDIDLTQVRERLKLTPAERLLMLQQFIIDLEAIRGAGQRQA
jgi:hypothetical protein